MINIKDYQDFLEERLVADGYVQPHALIFTVTDCLALKLTELFDNDIPRNSIMDSIAEFAQEQQAHKVIFVSEVFFCEANQEEKDRMMYDPDFRDSLEQKEALQILEITKHNVNMVIREFFREDNIIKLGTLETSDNLLYHAYTAIQSGLTTTM
jgi:hypothetical protein